jgi:hypothetical protein
VVIISGAVGRTEVRDSAGGTADAVEALAGEAVGGPIEIGGIAGRCCLPVEFAPMSIERVTMTAGGVAAAGVAAGFAAVLGGCGAATFPFEGVAWLAGARCGADFGGGEAAFGD